VYNPVLSDSEFSDNSKYTNFEPYHYLCGIFTGFPYCRKSWNIEAVKFEVTAAEDGGGFLHGEREVTIKSLPAKSSQGMSSYFVRIK
jgi:hypothetical protein